MGQKEKNNSVLTSKLTFIYLFKKYLICLISCYFSGPNEDVPYNSLSDLVKLCFGRPLNKTEQFSNWEKVPLRSNQIKYAGNYIKGFFNLKYSLFLYFF